MEGKAQSPSPSPSPSPPPPPPLPPPLPPPKITVLFSESADLLPARLPSVNEIERSPHILKELWSKRVVRVGEHYVVKYGGDTKPIEGENMKFARQHLKSVVPRLYAIYQKKPRPLRSEPTTYIVMEYVHGRPLIDVWSTMGEAERLGVTTSLHDSLRILRSIPPPDYFGSLGRTRFNDEIFGEPEDDTTTGPYQTESELIHAIILRYRKKVGDRLGHKADFYQHVLPRTLQGDGKPVFTHGDLQRKNILVGSGGKVTIIDWELSAWLPVWWEYVITMETTDWEDDWHRYVPRFLTEFPSHFAWFTMLNRELWY